MEGVCGLRVVRIAFRLGFFRLGRFLRFTGFFGLGGLFRLGFFGFGTGVIRFRFGLGHVVGDFRLFEFLRIALITVAVNRSQRCGAVGGSSVVAGGVSFLGQLNLIREGNRSEV